jgi:anthranilate phosphoribosyltransferase
VSNSIQAGVLLAKGAIESGAAKAKLEQLSAITKQLTL